MGATSLTCRLLGFGRVFGSEAFEELGDGHRCHLVLLEMADDGQAPVDIEQGPGAVGPARRTPQNALALRRGYGRQNFTVSRAR